MTADDVEDLRAIVGAFARSPLCERLAAATAVRREAGFAFSLEPGGGGSLVNGFVDVIATEPGGGRLIVDYKTDRLDGADPAEVLDRDYATQRVVYALAALRDGAPRVDVAYCFLERPGEPVVRGYTAADADALPGAGRLARPRRARRALRGHRPPAPRALRHLPGRRRCAPSPRSARWRRGRARRLAEGVGRRRVVARERRLRSTSSPRYRAQVPLDARPPPGYGARSAGSFAGSGGPS